MHAPDVNPHRGPTTPQASEVSFCNSCAPLRVADGIFRLVSDHALGCCGFGEAFGRQLEIRMFLPHSHPFASIAESVLTIRRKAQRNFCQLGPIFVQSDDIRSRLPEDAKRFEQMCIAWEDLMRDGWNSSLIVEIRDLLCGRPGGCA